MSLESIVGHIAHEAEAEREKILQEARREAERILQEARREAEALYREILDRERCLYEKERQRLLVNARLQARLQVLKTRQELIEQVFASLKSEITPGRFKKHRVLKDAVDEVPADTDFYLDSLRHDYEIEIARIIWG